MVVPSRKGPPVSRTVTVEMTEDDARALISVLELAPAKTGVERDRIQELLGALTRAVSDQ